MKSTNVLSALAALSFLALSTAAQAENPIPEIGQTIENVYLLQHCEDSEGYITQANRSYSVQKARCNDTEVILLTEHLKPDVDKKSLVRVLDKITFSATKNTSITTGYWCSLHGDKSENAYIEMVQQFDHQKMTNQKVLNTKNGALTKAWVSDTASKKLVQITPEKLAKIDCIDESKGEE